MQNGKPKHGGKQSPFRRHGGRPGNPSGGRHHNNPHGGGGNNPGTPATPGTPEAPLPWDTSTQSAFDTMVLTLQDYGLGSLAEVLRGLILDGVTDQASLTLALQDTNEWRTRFAGNEQLRQAGLPVLSVSEYLSVERSYAQVLKNYGLPAGFYDDPSDFAKWIGGSVSSNELQERAQMFSDISKRDDPAVRAQLQSMGFTEGDMLAHLMDPSKAKPLLQKQYQSTLIGAAARRNGVTANNDYIGHLSDMGVTEQQAQQGYGVIGENLADMQNIGDVYGENYSQRDFESEVFEQNGTATKKRKRLASQERGAFNGASGIGQGSLARPTGGSY